MSTNKGGRPRKPPGQKTIKAEVAFERDVVERIDEARRRRGLSRSAYIRQAVLLLLQRDEHDEREMGG